MQQTVKVVGIGGSPRPRSTAEQALRAVLAQAARMGADVSLISGAELVLPLYDPRAEIRSLQAHHLISEVASADGVVLASPAYHGSISGLVKNALDYLEELRDDERPYLSERAVACLAVAQGWQGAVSTLSALRGVTHALRGWPVPLGVAMNSAVAGFTADGQCDDPYIQSQLTDMAAQVMEFARSHKAAQALTVSSGAGRAR
ncbi:NAD(P)H-dependent oxidoreductase (plasmid) [Streptomyces sp. NBC_01340]|uniref:NADPH-dependent FMN reductase n=1 Tax=unclassified Streptomyces TaxID=2593676 RepID=UPI002252EF35|nr:MULTISPECIES: NAD(P)H-dependent oxidoreductase [unclassified Streptomyces]MCX4458640.1 NAD(P)H-dependent oxidoreductase [Streptomyces sp. NBC_01719]MCX4460485.1 NAD(P)H-dependent oxidoreductase [Streptomyces sp. NBC_01719]MCX4497997.1 NAD(P)H-dependent oxidoreductase [Streptomyces sp. NBC_01728]MCX4500185.1 NAD(P)H-dependent oxidoreductase [Streptomyces sp. NBC_01728]WSI45267.1 NAD(P)H-dependent oxidoreductase [Streptomyces sp. NBC_01340]